MGLPSSVSCSWPVYELVETHVIVFRIIGMTEGISVITYDVESVSLSAVFHEISRWIAMVYSEFVSNI